MFGSADDGGSGRTVTGVLHFPSPPPPRAARLVARVLDVSRADAPSVTLAESVLRDAVLTEGMPVEVDVSADVSRRPGSRILQVHIDLEGTEEVSPGDFLTTRSYPVLTTDGDDHIEVKLTRV